MWCNKSMLRGKFIAIQEAYLKKWKEHQINNRNLRLKQLEKEEKKPKVRRKEIINIRAEINRDEENRKDEWNIELTFWKIDKLLIRLIKKRGLKSIKYEMKMERSQQTTQKYKGS